MIFAQRACIVGQMAKLHSALLVLLSVIVLTLGCSKTPEGETKKWDANKKEVNALMAQYPGMKAPLQARLDAATKTWDAASGMSGDEQVKKMAAANSELMGGFVGQLGDVSDKLKKLRESAAEVTAKATDESSRQGAKVAAEDAKKTVDRVEKTLTTGAKDEAGATAVMKKVMDDIATSQSAIDKVAGADKEKTDKKEQEKADEKAAADKAAADKAAADKAAADKVADWTCEYCDAVNKHDATSCTSCSEPRSEKKKP